MNQLPKTHGIQGQKAIPVLRVAQRVHPHAL